MNNNNQCFELLVIIHSISKERKNVFLLLSLLPLSQMENRNLSLNSKCIANDYYDIIV